MNCFKSIFAIFLIFSIFPSKALADECWAPCATCEESDRFACLSCMPHHYIEEIDTGNRCRQCHESCKECTGKSENSCINCYEGYYKTSQGSCKPCSVENCSVCSEGDGCDKCIDGYYFQNNACLPCHETCSECTGPNSNQCKVCANGYYDPLSSDTEHTCSKCVDTCKKCHGPNIEHCDECSDGYYKSGNRCIQCDPECRTCSEKRNHCTSCNEGHYLKGSICSECATGCATCLGDDSEHCRSCIDGYAYNGKYCKDCRYYSDYSGCTKCAYVQSTNSIKCLECPPGYKEEHYPDGTLQCVSCDQWTCLSCPEDNQICKQCQSRYYLTTNGKCEECTSPCQNCEGSPTQCTSCIDRYYFDNETKTCKECSENCIKCKSNTECTVCDTTYYPSNGKCEKCDDSCQICHDNTNACDQCKSGYYYNEDDKCEKCSQHCLSCDSADKCNYCDKNFYSVNGVCQPCADVCEACHGPTIDDCYSCDPGYYFSWENSACFKCNDACQTCDEGPGDHQCFTCAPGYFMAKNIPLPDGSGLRYNRCVPCEPNCKNCTSYTNCLECKEGYRSYIKEGESEPDCEPCKNSGCKKCDSGADKCTECLDGFYISSTNDNFVVCSRCESECKKCDQNKVCTECADGFYNDGGTCTQCLPPCKTCKSNKECLSCIDGHLLDEYSSCSSYCEYPCLTCEGKKDFCTSCSYEYSLSGSKCIKCTDNCKICHIGWTGSMDCKSCNDGFYLSGSICHSCHPSCANCFGDGSGSCTSCAEGYYFSRFNIFDGQKYTGECSLCNGAGHENCLECISNCDDDAMSCNEMPICTKCSEDHFIDDNGQCQQCHPSCATCNGPAENNCLTCKEGLSYYDNSCHECASSCVTCMGSPEYCTSCRPGQYANEGKCNNCKYDTCAECLNQEDYCTKCANGKYSYEGKCYSSCLDAGENLGLNVTTKECYKCPKIDYCLKYDDSCQCEKCEDGSYIITDPTTHDEYCLPCTLDKCKKCTGSNKNDCTECIDGYYVYTYSNTGTKECVACKSPCTVCSTETKCTACIDGYFSNSKTECEQCHSPCSSKCGGTDGNICYDCDSGYYHTDNNECKSCDPSCSSCSGSTNNDCSACNPGYHLVGTTCTKCASPCATCSDSDGSHCLSCPKGYYLTGTTCGQCSSDCGTCDGSSDKCTGCKEGFYLSGTECKSCATGCATCNNSPNECQTCISGYQLVGTSCEPCQTGCATCEGSTTNCSSCIDGYYHQNDNTCHQCESPCATCTGPGNNTCKSCIKRYVLNGTICVIAPDDCESNKHCEKDNTDGKEYLDYKVELPLHEDYTNDESGGGIRLINYGFTGESSIFKNCVSVNGGGGGIFIYNNIQNTQSKYSISLKKLTFESCKGFFGAAVYIYSPSEESPVVIESCKFLSNEVYSTPNSNPISGGSALYLTVKNGKINDCTFADNKGPGGIIKVCEDFNERPEGLEVVKNNYTQGHLLIKDCTFVSEEASGSSIYFASERLLSKVEVFDCKFTGNLAKDAHYIDGKLVLTEKSRVVIKSCKFDSDKNKALNSKFIKVDLMNNLLANNSFGKKNNQSNLWLILPTIAVATLAVIAFFVVKKRLNNDEADSNNNGSAEA